MKFIYVYVLRSDKDGYWYTGYTHDLKKRFQQHKAGETPSTRHRGPWQLIYYEASINEDDARAREKYLKSGMGKRYIRNRLKLFMQRQNDDL
jgi:putative endonuclease